MAALKRSFMKVSKADFLLVSFAIKNGTYTTRFKTEEGDGDGLYDTEPSIPRTIEPHKDLYNCLNELKEHLLNYQASSSVLKRVLKESKNKIITSQRVLDDVVSEMSKMLALSCRITKVDISTKEVGGTEVKFIIIKGELNTFGGKSVKIETPKINLESKDYGFESQLKTIIEELEDEVFQYLFHNKVGGQMSLFEQDTPEKKADVEKSNSKMKAVV